MCGIDFQSQSRWIRLHLPNGLSSGEHSLLHSFWAVRVLDHPVRQQSDTVKLATAVYVLHVLSPEELNPDLKGDLKLVDVEDHDIAEITVSRPLMEKYKRTLAAFIDGAREFCTRRGMNYLMTSTETSSVRFAPKVGSYTSTVLGSKLSTR